MNYPYYREQMIKLFLEGVESVKPANLFKDKIFLSNHFLEVTDVNTTTTSLDLDKYERIIVLGAGKASAEMGKCFEEISSGFNISGTIVTKYGFGTKLNKLELIESDHPTPDENGLNASKRIMSIAKGATENDLIIFLLSGGASSLLPLPPEGITLEDKIKVSEILLKCGADINEFNTVRKHLSQIKGGLLAKNAYPAKVVTLIISDVINDPIDIIGSGPTFPDNSTFSDAYNIFKKYELLEKIPQRISEYLLNGMQGKIEETPKNLSNSENIIIANNSFALKTVKNSADKLGFDCEILCANLSGDQKKASLRLIETAKNKFLNREGDKPIILVTGGETTVKIIGKGKGGRNQQLALEIINQIKGLDNFVFLSAGTDGNDGPTDAAGALVDNTTITRSIEKSISPIEFLKNNDSYNFFHILDDLIITGPTNTNVMDIQLFCIW